MSVAYDDFDDDRDHSQAMIDWLKDKSPDVWFDVAQSLNWDNAMGVLDWIVSQPQCDRANAALVFWGCDPFYYLRTPGSETDHISSEGFALLDKVLRNWKAGFYKRAELASDDDWRQRYRDVVASLPNQHDRFAIPRDLLGPFHGRKPNVPKHLSKYHDPELRKLFWNLGTDIGHDPDSKEARRIELRLRRNAVMAFWGDIFGFWLRCVPWLAAFAVLAIGGAFVLRYLVKGVVF